MRKELTVEEIRQKLVETDETHYPMARTLLARVEELERRDCGTEDDVCLYLGEGLCRSCAHHTKMTERVEELEAAMQQFVNRCDRGEVRSIYTYTKFKRLLHD